MTSEQRMCPITGQPITDDVYIHPDAATTAIQAAKQLPTLMWDVQTAKTTGAVRFTDPAPTTHAYPRLPVRLDIMLATHPIEHDLKTHIRHLEPTLPPALTWPTIAKLYMRHAANISSPHAPTTAALIIDSTHKLTRIIDAPPVEQFIGRCLTPHGEDTCNWPIYVKPGRTQATCDNCHTQWDTYDLRRQHLESAVLWRVSASQAITILAALGVSIKAGTLRMWRKRGKLPLSTDGAYSVGDLLQVAKTRTV